LANCHGGYNIFCMATIGDFANQVVSRDEAESILAPYLDDIPRACFLGIDSWTNFATTMPALRVPLTQRTEANFINDHVVQCARQLFLPDKEKEIDHIEEGGLFAVGFKRKLLLRFKKSRDGDLTSNIQTNQQKDIGCQQLLIPGWKQATWIYACYHVAADAIDRVVITCRLYGHLVWAPIVLFDGSFESEAAGVLPFAADAQSVPQRRSRVVPKNLTIPEGE
jgi:hypothetical protein